MFEINKFRADFALVWATEQARGDAGVPRLAAYGDAFRLVIKPSGSEMQEAGRVVQAHMHDAAWMANAAAHYAEMAGAIRRDMERAQQIRIEMHAERVQRVAA